MARRRKSATVDDPYAPVIEWYRDRLTRPAPPVETYVYPPSAIGPTWQRTPDGYWALPERTLGWWALAWTGVWLQQSRGQPWRWTDEQARFWLWWYATDERGQFVYRDGVLQRLKGWGKDPVGAGLAANEAFGFCRVEDVDEDGHPIPTDCPEAWVQTAAVSLEQTKNTMRLFPSLFTDEAKEHYGIHVGKEQVHGLGGTRMIQAVTSSPATLEGARATFVLLNETHHWLANNEGHEMAAVIERNATKSADGAARTLRITNAFEPSEDSVAQQDREQWENADSGEMADTGLLYDSLEAPPEAPLSLEAAPEVIRAVRGDSVWLNVDRIVQSIADGRNPPSRSRRFWYNQVVAAEDAWIDPADYDMCEAPSGVRPLAPGDEIALFFDGSKSDDATVLVGSRVEDGLTFVIGFWQRPPGKRGDGWLAPRHEVDRRVDEVFEHYRPVGFFGDPSHAADDETQERYWDGLFDEWHRRYADRLEIWATPGRDGHAIMWDMASPRRVAEFTAAAERTVSEIEATAKARRVDPEAPYLFMHDGDSRLRQHFRNARRYPNKFGVSLWKGHRESKRKVDAAVAAVGARMVRRLVLNNPKRMRKRTGNVW